MFLSILIYWGGRDTLIDWNVRMLFLTENHAAPSQALRKKLLDPTHSLPVSGWSLKFCIRFSVRGDALLHSQEAVGSSPSSPATGLLSWPPRGRQLQVGERTPATLHSVSCEGKQTCLEKSRVKGSVNNYYRA